MRDSAPAGQHHEAPPQIKPLSAPGRSMIQPAASSYDSVPYPSNPFPQTHPDRLATIATLYGMRPAPPPVETARVLEIGCAEAANLIPLALQHPSSQLVGIDASAV